MIIQIQISQKHALICADTCRTFADTLQIIISDISLEIDTDIVLLPSSPVYCSIEWEYISEAQMGDTLIYTSFCNFASQNQTGG